MITTADLLKLITGQELNNANSVGNAEVQEPAKEEDGAVDMMDAIRLPFLYKLQECSQTIEELKILNNFGLQKIIPKIKSHS